jgi:A/G-specific adenine glycosylase
VAQKKSKSVVAPRTGQTQPEAEQKKAANASAASSYAQPLLKWFDRNQRDLPWRKQKTPYRVWVSEIMLQQTQVKTVVNYYQRFMARFPTVEALAAADQAEVLKLWEGLGYYRRARQLHEAAITIVTDYGSEFPADFAQVVRLPGIGRYTAGAILSIALDQRLPVLEGNTIRLYSRLIAMRDDPRLPGNQKKLWQFAESILPRKRTGDFNQALMELGSEICKPQLPLCSHCPLRGLCAAFAKGLEQQIPSAGKKLNYESITEALVLIKRKNKFLVRQCAASERWSGLFDFPRFPLHLACGKGPLKKSIGQDAGIELAGQIRKETGLEVELNQLGWERKHAVTRYRIRLLCFESTKVVGQILTSGKNWKWQTLNELTELPMSVTGRELVNSILKHEV